MRSAIFLLALAPLWLSATGVQAAHRHKAQPAAHAAAKAPELRNRTADVDDDCARPATWAVKQACKASAAKAQASTDACAKLKSKASRRTCLGKAEAKASEPAGAAAPAIASVSTDCAKVKGGKARRRCEAAHPTPQAAVTARVEAATDACAKLRKRAARRSCEARAKAAAPVAVLRGAVEDCAKLKRRAARQACDRKVEAVAAPVVAAAEGEDCDRLKKRAARRTCEARVRTKAAEALRRAQASQGDCSRLRSASARRACTRQTADARPRKAAPDRRFPKAPPPVQRAATATPAKAQEIVVEDGDTAFDIAARFGVSVRALAQLNGLQEPYDPPPGTRLKIPPRTAATAAASPPAAPRTTPSREEPTQVASAPRPYSSLAGARPTPPPVAPSATSVLTPNAPISTARRGARTEADALAAVAVAATRAPPPLPDDAGRGRFIWPLKGSVLSGYGPKGPGLRNDGLDIAVRPGDAVHAAADGEVVYAGKEIAAFGNLVLLKHAGGWVTAYAHLGRIGVAMRQTVAQGQSIGEAGDSGSVESPRLHFEVRAPGPAGAKPVDPASVLPAS